MSVYGLFIRKSATQPTDATQPARLTDSRKHVDKRTDSVNLYIKPRDVIDIAAAEDADNKLRNEEQFAMNELKVLNFRTCTLHASAAKLGNDYKKHETTVGAVRARLHNIQAQRNGGAANATFSHLFILLVHY